MQVLARSRTVPKWDPDMSGMISLATTKPEKKDGREKGGREQPFVKYNQTCRVTVWKKIVSKKNSLENTVCKNTVWKNEAWKMQFEKIQFGEMVGDGSGEDARV